MDQIILSRKELYELVWKESMLSLSKRFEISDVGLRKICLRMEIPLPPAGYWAKIQFGKKVKQATLTTQHKGEGFIQLRLRDENSTASKSNSVRSTKIIEVENDNKVTLQVPEKLAKPDPLVLSLKVFLLNRNQILTNT
ncbi:MAG: hypothetical protein QM763_18950 [Agriterribacter sp.]